MSSYSEYIRPYVDAEIDSAIRAEADGNLPLSFQHLERAHVLAQPSTVQHVRVHWQMLRWGWRTGDGREVLGQILRISAAAALTAFGFVPTGNTGGANVSPVQPMPVPEELATIIRQARALSQR